MIFCYIQQLIILTKLEEKRNQQPCHVTGQEKADLLMVMIPLGEACAKKIEVDTFPINKCCDTKVSIPNLYFLKLSY